MLTKKITLINFSIFLLITITGYSQINAPDSLPHNPQLSVDSINSPVFFASTTIFQKIKQDSFYQVILKTNFDSLIKNKKVSTEHHPGTILFKNEEGEEIKMNVKIEPRGRSRRKYCSSMPPLKIDFPKKALQELGLFPGCDKLKLVTNCNDTENSDQVLMKEYWIYNLYNKITPQSFEVFPVKITYIDENNPSERIQRFAFFIESNEEVALRLKGESVDMFGTTPEKLESTSYHNTLLFQYMIGNLDWDIMVQRNVKFIQPDKGDQPILIPYDFDFSGLVKAPHARLNPDYNQKNIEERFPQGKFASKEALMNTVKVFKNLEKEGFRCYMNCSILTKSEKKKMNKYLTSFYRIIRDKAYLQELFLGED